MKHPEMVTDEDLKLEDEEEEARFAAEDEVWERREVIAAPHPILRVQNFNFIQAILYLKESSLIQ